MTHKADFRIGVGIILCNAKSELLWAKRIGQVSWQFPQGGLHENESPLSGLYRELHEELGLSIEDVTLLGQTKNWLHYRYPAPRPHYDNQKNPYIGQKQKWFLLQLMNKDSSICLNRTNAPEFDQWQWVNYWYPIDHVVDFKRALYQAALNELSVFLPCAPLP